MIKTRRRGKATEYYLLAMEGDSVLYNGWYQMDSSDKSVDSLANLPECTITSWTIRYRIINHELLNFTSLWQIVSTPALKQCTKVRRPQKEGKKAGRKPSIKLTDDEQLFTDNMALFKPGSLAHTVR